MATNLFIEVTNACNENCCHCDKRWRNDDKQVMPYEIIDKVLTIPKDSLVISGGEPGLAKAQVKYIIEKSDTRVMMNTNLTLWDDDELAMFNEKNVGLMVSVVSLTRKTYKDITGRDLVDELKKRLEKINRGSRITIVINEKNMGEIESMVEYLIARGFGNFVIQPAIPGKDDSFDYTSYQQQVAVVRKLYRKYKDIKIQCMCYYDSSASDLPVSYLCDAGKERLGVLPSGDVVPCNCLHAVSLGNVMCDDWNRIRMNGLKYFYSHKEPERRVCKAFLENEIARKNRKLEEKPLSKSGGYMINVNCIFVMLGQECNLACKYCIQHEIEKTQLCHKMNPDVISWIIDIASQRKNPVDIRFYGGEPLLFWKNIQDIVKALEDAHANVKFTTISNGKLLTKEHVEYFNAHGFGVGISWDGPNSRITRGYDVMAEKEDLVMALDNLTISTVLSEYNYPLTIGRELDRLHEKYIKLHSYDFGLALEEPEDMNGSIAHLIPQDEARVEREIEILCQEVLNDNESGKGFSGNRYWENVIYMTLVRMENLSKSNHCTAYCGNGISTQNVDLDGNIYLCHNVTDKKVGTIYDDFISVFRNVISLDDTKKFYENSCHDCEIESICGGGCMLISQHMRDMYYCRLRKAIYRPILKAVQKMLEQGSRGLFAREERD